MTTQQWNNLLDRAKAGDTDAQWQVGAWLEEGLTGDDGTVIARPSPAAAVRWYRLAAAGGDACAQINLGNCLSEGRGVRKNEAEALCWYKRAFRQGYASAASNIGVLYRDQGKQRRALFWYRRATACGDGDSWVEVGDRYYDGVGVRRDASEAVRCFREAVASAAITQAGREDAMHRLGAAYLDGCGVRRSPARALAWLTRANRDGDRPDTLALIDRLLAEHARPKGARADSHTSRSVRIAPRKRLASADKREPPGNDD